MTLVWRPGFQFDADASTYIEAVEAADTQALETGVRYAINDFVIGCKNDGIWDAIKASCILAGARTLAGALVPLVGAAPTNYNFVAGDYNRETGLVGDGSTKYLDSNRAGNSEATTNKHLSFFTSQKSTVYSAISGPLLWYIGTSPITPGSIYITPTSSGNLTYRINGGGALPEYPDHFSGFTGVTRTSVTEILARSNQVTQVRSQSVAGGTASSIEVLKNNARLAFYSIGEALDLAALDTRVSALITAIGAAIP